VSGSTATPWQPADRPLFEAQPLPVPPSLLGESPFWHPNESALYWCDIPGRQLHRFHPATGEHRHWAFDCEPCSVAPMLRGRLMLAMRDGLWRFDPATGERARLAPPPYDTAHERFNDGKADAQGRFWVGTIYEPRDPPRAMLYRWAAGRLDAMAGDATVSNGLGWSLDGRTLYWSDTKAHTIYAFDMDPADGSLSRRRVFARFPATQAGAPLLAYGGRPDGAAVDSEGCYWSAMFEGQRLLRQCARWRCRCAAPPCLASAMPT
jgi:sugar lactone lactonase YvrE